LQFASGLESWPFGLFACSIFAVFKQKPSAAHNGHGIFKQKRGMRCIYMDREILISWSGHNQKKKINLSACYSSKTI
jgi:hypothetical protein